MLIYKNTYIKYTYKKELIKKKNENNYEKGKKKKVERERALNF